MKMSIRKYIAAMTAAVTMLSGAAAVSAAEDPLKIVVIGDGISSGAMLADGEKSYVQIVEEYAGAAEVQNFAQEGFTIADLLAQLEETEVQNALQEADLIFVSIGTHDALDPFMAKAHSFMEEFEFAQFADVFTAQLEDHVDANGDPLTETTLQTVYAPQLKEAALQNREAAAADILLVGEALSGYEGKVVYQTVYNCIDTIENLYEISSKRRLAYNSICNPVSSMLNDAETSINASLRQMAEEYDCVLVDSFTGFDDYAYKYVNLDELDVHPTAEGHRWIATEVLAASGLLKKGDVNGDAEINAMDATEILIYAAAVGAGGEATLTDGQLSAADVNADAERNAMDATKILMYAAEAGAGGNPSWD